MILKEINSLPVNTVGLDENLKNISDDFDFYMEWLRKRYDDNIINVFKKFIKREEEKANMEDTYAIGFRFACENDKEAIAIYNYILSENNSPGPFDYQINILGNNYYIGFTSDD